MTWIMLVVLGTTLVTAFRRGSDLLSPSRIYICIYSFLLCVYHLNLSKLQTPWSQTTIMLFYGASAMFLFGGTWIWLLGRSTRPDWNLDFNRVKYELEQDAATMDWAWFTKVYVTSILGYAFSFLISMAIVGGVPAFMEDPDKARLNFFSATTLTNYGIFLGPISLMLGMVLLWFSRPDRRRRRNILLSLGLVLGMYLTIVTRYDLFRFLVFSVVIYHYGIQRLKPIHALAGVGMGASLFMIGFLVRVKTDAISTFNEFIQVKMPPHLAWASNIYAYLANDFWNFDYAIKKFADGDHQYPLQYGVGMFRALLWNLRIEPALDMAYRFDTMLNESAEKVQGLNTVIYVWHFYKDFGFAGCFLLPLIGSVLLWKFYLNTVMTPTVIRVAIWGILAGGITLSYHTPLWELWFVYLNVLVFLVAHRKIKLA
jgi:oligosaccharide repeat unit polymerase